MYNDPNGQLDVSKMDGPIPGESLTTMPGSAPWEKAPQHVDLNDLLEMIWAKLNNPRFATVLYGLLKAGSPADAIAKSVMLSAFYKGVCTVDMCLLAMPTVVRQIVAIGHFMGVKKIKIKSPDPKQQALYAKIANLIDSTGGITEPAPDANTPAQPPTAAPSTGILGI